MRTNGVDEKYCTGDASDWEKFEKWAETVPQTLRNPLYHWTHLELKKFFGINEVLSPKNARAIYDACNEKLHTPESVSYTHLRAHETRHDLVCRLLLEKKK